MAPVILSVTMFSLLLLMMIDVVQCSTVADEAYDFFNVHNPIANANQFIKRLSKPEEYYFVSNKEHLIEQLRARISMTQPTIDELTQLYKAKFGDIAERPKYIKLSRSNEEFDPDDQVKAKQLLDKLKESRVWFRNLDILLHYKSQLEQHYSTVNASEELLQGGYELLSRTPKIAHQNQAYLDDIQANLNKVKQTLDQFATALSLELDVISADVVGHEMASRIDKDEIYSAYHTAEDELKKLWRQCVMLNEKLDDQLMLAESDNDESDDERPQDDEQLKKAKAELRDRRRFLKFRQDAHKQMLGNPSISEHLMKTKRENLQKDWNYKQEAKLKVKEAKKSSILASNLSGSQENQQKTPIFQEPGSGESQAVTPAIPIKVSTQSSQEDQRPFWKKKRYYIPASVGAGAGILFTGFLLDLHNIIPQMIWGSKENDASTKVNPPNSTTTDTSTDSPTHPVVYLTVVIIVLVVLALLAVGFVVFLKRCKNGTSDLELGKPSHKSQAASTMTLTTTGTEIPLTPTRSTNATSSKAKSKKDSPGTASTPVFTKTKSKGSSQK